MANQQETYRSRYAICDDCECVTIIERNDDRGVPEEISWEEFGRCLVCGGTLRYFDANPQTVDDTYFALGRRTGHADVAQQIEALCQRWDKTTKGESPTTRTIREVLAEFD